jgi:hypothetical protein
MPHEEFPEDDIFGEWSYLTYMAQHASKGAPLPVFWNMSEEKSGNFEKAMDDYIGMSGHNDADPLAGYEDPEDFEDPYDEEEWWAFDTFFGSALQDSFDTMEDGNMEQGLDGVDDIVSSAILTYDAQPGSFARLDPPFPIIDQPMTSAELASLEGAWDIEEQLTTTPPSPLPTYPMFDPPFPIPEIMDLPMAPEPPPGLLAVPGPVPQDSIGSGQALAIGPSLVDPMSAAGSTLWDAGRNIVEGVGDIGSNIWDLFTQGQEASAAGQQTLAGGYSEIVGDIGEGVGGFAENILQDIGETELQKLGLEVPEDPSIQRGVFAAFDQAYPDIDQIQILLDPSEMGGAGYTASDLQTWLEWSGRKGRGAEGDEDVQRQLEQEFGVQLIPTSVVATPTPTADQVEGALSIAPERTDFPPGTEGEQAYEDELAARNAALGYGDVTKGPSYADQFTRIFNNIPGSQRFEAQRGLTGMFNDAEMLFYLSEDWSAKEGASREWLAGTELEGPSFKFGEQERKGEELVFANWVQNTYLQNPRQTRFGEEFYGNVRGLRDRMFQIKDLTMEELYGTLTSDWEKAPQPALGDPPFPLPEGQYQQTPAQAKKTVMDRFIFMAPENSDRLAKLVGMYNIHPGTDHWLKSKMLNFYSGMMDNWKASGRDSYDFIKTFVKDKPAMPGGGEAPSTDGYQGDYVRPYFGPDDTVPTGATDQVPPGTDPILGTGAQMDAYIKSLKNTFGGAATTPVHTSKGYEPIPPGMVRMGTGEIVTLDELARRTKRPRAKLEEVLFG